MSLLIGLLMFYGLWTPPLDVDSMGLWLINVFSIIGLYRENRQIGMHETLFILTDFKKQMEAHSLGDERLGKKT